MKIAPFADVLRVQFRPDICRAHGFQMKWLRMCSRPVAARQTGLPYSGISGYGFYSGVLAPYWHLSRKPLPWASDVQHRYPKDYAQPTAPALFSPNRMPRTVHSL